MRTVVALVAVSLSASAIAATWVEVAALEDDGSVMSVDTAGIAREDGFLKAWFKSTYKKPQSIPRHASKVDPKQVDFDESLELDYFNCTSRTMAGKQWIYRSKGKPVASYEDYPHYSDVAPETVGESMLEFVCGRKFEAKSAKPVPREAELERDSQQQQMSPPAKMTRPANPEDYYPPGSIRREEQGNPMVLACVGPSGRLLREPVVIDTSGFPELDNAAIKVAKATQYAAGTDERGAALQESCLKFKIKFVMKND
jgi:TonB family protein